MVAIASSRCVWEAGRSATSLGAVLDLVGRGGSFSDCAGGREDADGAWAIEHVRADTLVESTPTNLFDGEPGTTHLRAALSRGFHVVTSTKGPLVHHLRELRGLATTHGKQLRIGAATAAALPTVDLAESCLAGAEITRVEGILNGTSNFVLTEIGRGAAFEEALALAQERGIAEKNADLDVAGYDTAAKLVLIAGWIWDSDLRIHDIPVKGIVGLGREELEKAARLGERIKLVGAAWRDSEGVHAQVAPISLPEKHPLAYVNGSEKGATFTTDTMDQVTVVGGKSDPTGAAAALLRDVLRVADADR